MREYGSDDTPNRKVGTTFGSGDKPAAAILLMSPLILGLTYTRKKELELQVDTRRRGPEPGRVRHPCNKLAQRKTGRCGGGDDDLVIRTELVGGVGKYGRLLGWLYIGDGDVSLNEQMIDEGYAWAYDGGTKQKDFEELREIRRALGTLV